MNSLHLKFACIFFLLFMSSSLMAQTASKESRQVVKAFLEDVRSGRNPQNAYLYLADSVNVHQVTMDLPENFTITPGKTEIGIRERKKHFGDVELEIKELISEGEKVFVRWEEIGKHIGNINGYEATGADITTLASCVYLVKDKKIVEYWIQVDYWGLSRQLEASKSNRPKY